MEDIYRIMKYHLYINKNNKPIYFLLNFPLLLTILMINYLSLVEGMSSIDTIILFIELIAIYMPFQVSLLIGLDLKKFEDSNYMFFLSRDISKAKKWVAIFIVYIVVILLQVLINTFIYLWFTNSLDIQLMIRIILYMGLQIFFLLSFHFFVTIKLDFSSSILIGILGCLLVAILDTGIGDGIWMFSPLNWGSRMSYLYLTNTESSLLFYFICFFLTLLIFNFFLEKNFERME